MIRVTVAREHAKTLREGVQPLEVVDEQGAVFGCYWQAFWISELAEARQKAATEPGEKTTE